ncbi:MAG: hypothetical protein PHY02_09565 [Phycisphaerae bacterium]|nr:hypothetical protein [Phycisphaerae bacterium]
MKIKNLILIFLFATILFGYSPGITSFNTGQISPYMEARSDFVKYPSFCRTLENMVVLAQGPVTRRPGTKYIATAKSENCVLIPFEYSTDDTYILEFGDEYIRFYRNGGQILDPCDPNIAYEITTVFDINDVAKLRYAQSNNVMYLVDGSDEPQKLTRTSHTSWTIEDANIVTGPFQIANTEDINIVPSDVNIGESITLMADSNIFLAGHVGALWQISQERTSSTLTGTLDANGSSVTSGYFEGSYSFVTTGTWEGTITLQRSTNGGITWDAALTPLSSTNYDNPSETEADGAVYRITMSAYVSGECEYTLTIGDTLNNGIVKITAVTDGNEAVATVITELVNTDATNVWREGYWSDYRGWPKTVCFHQQRLIFGGSESFPQTMWFGKQDPDDYTNFSEGSADTSSFTMALQGQNPLQWMLSGDYIFIGTSGSVGKYGKQGEAITPTSPSYNEQTKNGSADMQAVFANDSILYVERGNRKIRELAYSLQSDKFVSPDLTILSENITQSDIKDIAFQARPNPILWCVLNDGNMATLTFQRDQEIISWAMQTTDGNFVSVSVIPSGGEDEVWVETSRTISGSEVFYIEQFQPFDWGTDNNDCFFVDCGLDYDSTATDSFGGLSHLEGKSVSVYADGIALSNVTVSGGTTTIANSAGRVIIGLPFTSKLETIPITIDPQDKAMNKKITRVNIDFLNTGYCKYGFGRYSELIPVNFWNNFTTAKQPLYTSEDAPYDCAWPFGPKKKATIYLETDKPLPLCVRSIIPEIEVTK